MAMAMKGCVAKGMAMALTVLSLGMTSMADGECSAAAPCPDSTNCCSQHGFCGKGVLFCGEGCKTGPCTGGPSPPPPGPPGPPGPPSSFGDILPRSSFEQFFPGHLSFYSYDALVEAARQFPKFGTTGDITVRKREIAAYVAHVTQETSGLKKIVEQNIDPYCKESPQFPCNKKHFNGRGPLQLSWNYNYGACGKYLKIDLLGNPDLVATDPLISFKTSLWFWNEYGDDVIPHIHDVVTGNWKQKSADMAAKRVPGFGVTIAVINGGQECGKESPKADNRVRYYKNFCSLLKVDPGANLDCKQMKPF